MGGDNSFTSELNEEQLNIYLLHQQKLTNHVGPIIEEESKIDNVKDQIVKEDELSRFTSFLRVDNSFFTPPCWNPSHDQIGKEGEFSRFTCFLWGNYGGIKSIRYMNFAPGSFFSVDPVCFLSDIHHYRQSSGTMSEAPCTDPKTSEEGKSIGTMNEAHVTTDTKVCEEGTADNWEEDEFFSHTKLSLFLRKIVTIGGQSIGTMTEAPRDTDTKACEEKILVNNWEEEDDDFLSYTKLSLFLRKIVASK